MKKDKDDLLTRIVVLRLIHFESKFILIFNYLD